MSRPTIRLVTDVAGLVADLVTAGIEVVAPVQLAGGAVEYRAVSCLVEATLGGALPRLSLKAFFLPPSEPLLAWRYEDGGVVLHSASERPAQPLVVLGARPCDAAALDIVDRVMGWDERDELWFGRREATTVISVVCPGCDDCCFCDAVGLGRSATRGADLLLEPDGDQARVTVLSNRGRALVDAYSSRFQSTEPEPESGVGEGTGITVEEIDAAKEWLAGAFDHPVWQEIALACHGCGVCAAVCPTCHCFDIVDEPEGVTSGVRRRCWDTCQTAGFTVHASGHNPRSNQDARLRQRLLHKFFIYPERFGDTLCTGCGRCARACPAGIHLPELLRRLGRLAAEASAGDRSP